MNFFGSFLLLSVWVIGRRKPLSHAMEIPKRSMLKMVVLLVLAGYRFMRTSN